MVSPDGASLGRPKKKVFGPPDNLTEGALSNGGANELMCVFPNVSRGLAKPARMYKAGNR